MHLMARQVLKVVRSENSEFRNTLLGFSQNFNEVEFKKAHT